MPETNIIYDAEDNIVCIAKHGVAWQREPLIRLGEYDYGEEGFVYTNNHEKFAHFSEGVVKDLEGKELGRYDNSQLSIGDKTVGRFIGYDGAAVAALVFFFSASENADVSSSNAT